MKDFINKDLSKGGLIGGIVGAVASSKIHKPEDTMARKAVKTGLFAAIGFALGAFIEQLIGNRRK